MSASGPSSIKVDELKGVGPKTAATLSKLGIRTVRDALYFLPARYEDRGGIIPISSALPGQGASFKGKVVTQKLVRTPRGRMNIFELVVSDSTGYITAKWFNQPFLKGRFKSGGEVSLSGLVKANHYTKALEMDNPDYETSGGDIHTSGVIPVYPATEGISVKQLRSIIRKALDAHLDSMAEFMPEDVLERNGLPGLRQSIMNCHRPGEGTSLEELNSWRSPWQRRLAFDELLLLELGLVSLRREASSMKGIAFKTNGRLREKLMTSLPFSLTNSQQKVIADITSDMSRPYPMNRLLQGDVGSGKTVVALIAMLCAVDTGWQTALMAPTEILAVQHYMNIASLLEPLGVKVELLTGGSRSRPYEGISSGEVDIVVGTHALFQEGVDFRRLGLIVIDEQHRFGVRQRALLRRKSPVCPDVLIMTATPIPRTLAMTAYGDLSYSVMDELPPGRSPVETIVVSEQDRAQAYDEISRELDAGGQVYVVYPAIEGEGTLGLKSATVGFEALSKRFPESRVSLVHGRMNAEERREAMSVFKSGNADILVSTTVIEVGVDVPNASLMVIVHAERFGLSQLHQLRGRVGRGRRKSRCILLAYGPIGEEASRRLEVMASTGDGFRVAEEDLMLRGPGEVMGTRQSGMPDLRIADIIRDREVLEAARGEAERLLEEDASLKEHPALKEALGGFWEGRIEIFRTG